MSDKEIEYQKYVKDSRIPCKYGAKCYQKNPVHHQKYKHPPGNPDNKNKHIIKRRRTGKDKVTQVVTKQDDSDSDSISNTDNYTIEDGSDSDNAKKTIVNNDVSESDSENESSITKGVNNISESNESNSDNDTSEQKLDPSGDKVQEEKSTVNEDRTEPTTSKDIDKTSSPSKVQNKITDIFKRTSVNDFKEYSEYITFIKDKFLVEMPKDFYQFWNFCKILKKSNPLEALKDIGLSLVGPFDVLAGKFVDVKKTENEYLIHWRYYRDPPEFQTVLKGDDKTGYHIGYFRDSPNELPVFLCSNQSKKDGILTAMGENIFAAVNFYLEDLKKTGDPFKKMNIGRIQPVLKKEADRLKLNLSKKTNAMIAREKQIVTRTFNKIGLVVPFDKKSDVGYRELALDNKALNILLTKLQNAELPEQKTKLRSELQPVFTYASIAADECDFGTSIELGWNLIAHGIDSLDTIIMDFLVTGYKLLNKPQFGKIAEAHMKNRRKGTSLSVL